MLAKAAFLCTLLFDLSNLQRNFSDYVSGGAEIYYQGAQFAGDKESTFYNFGGQFGLTKKFSILFSLGHTFSGDNQSVAYFALGWTGLFDGQPGP